MRKLIIALIVLMSGVGLACALPADLKLDTLSQEIGINEIGTYNLTLNTTEAGELHWGINDSNISAKLDSESFAQTGNISVPIGVSTHILYVKPLPGIILGTPYDITIWHTQGGGIVAKALATAGVIPTPELSTVILTSGGILGLVGISRMKRKK